MANPTTAGLIKLQGDPLGEYKPHGLDQAAATQYFGFADIHGRWYIQKLDTATGLITYTFGTTDYPTNWTGRAALTYDYLYNLA